VDLKSYFHFFLFLLSNRYPINPYMKVKMSRVSVPTMFWISFEEVSKKYTENGIDMWPVIVGTIILIEGKI